MSTQSAGRSALVKDVDGGQVGLVDGRRLRAATLVWTAGVRASRLAERLGELGRSGAVSVDPTLQLPGHPEVFVVGDLAAVSHDGAQLPMLAAVAIQQGAHAARTIGALVRGASPRPFRYRDRGIMATIGRNAAVAQLGTMRLHGRAGWLAWLSVHLVLIVTFRSKLLTLLNWAWDYLFYDRPIRLIMIPTVGPEAEAAVRRRKMA